MKSGDGKQRENGKMPGIIINDHGRPLRRQRNVIPVWHWIFPAIGHAQGERHATFHGGLDLLTRHNSTMARSFETRKRFLSNGYRAIRIGANDRYKEASPGGKNRWKKSLLRKAGRVK